MVTGKVGSRDVGKRISEAQFFEPVFIRLGFRPRTASYQEMSSLSLFQVYQLYSNISPCFRLSEYYFGWICILLTVRHVPAAVVQTPKGKGQVLLEHEQDVHRLLFLGHIEHKILGYMEYVREGQSARWLLIQPYVE